MYVQARFQAAFLANSNHPGFAPGEQMLQPMLRMLREQMLQQLQMSQRRCGLPSRPRFGSRRCCGSPRRHLRRFCGGFQPRRCGRPRPHCGRGTGHLQQEKKGKPISYTTKGGYKVLVNKHDITITDPKGNKLKHWGDPHENLNGKHLKDWEGKQRSVILDDGTKITMTADGPHGVTQHTSIYDGRQNVQIANAGNEIQHHSFNARDTHLREALQHDGETARFSYNRQGDGMYYNLYNEAANGGFTYNLEKLGESVDGRVHDYYDDKRLGHT